MGGGTSKFEETDWNLADGKLTDSTAETIDGAPPTSDYQIYTLTKRGLNQRNFDVTDDDSNLLYSTRAVEGTLAWFDVLGRGINEYLVRVQVDLSRRYWVIYRYGEPTFSGQIADMEATMRLERREFNSDSLYRKACITVTWSRYHAVVNMYKAPSLLSLDGVRVRDDEGGNAEESENGAKDVPKEAVEEDTSLCAVNETQDDNVKDEDEAEDKDARVTEESSSVEAIKGTEGDADQPNHPENGDTSPRKDVSRSVKLKRWMSMKAARTVEYVSTNPHRPDNTDEGVILLDEPILMCQEINSFMGQHQTMLIHKDEVQEFKEQEIQAELEEQRQAQSTLTASQSAEGINQTDFRPAKSAPASRLSSWKNNFFGASRTEASVEPNLSHSKSFSDVSSQRSPSSREGNALLRDWNVPHRSDSMPHSFLKTDEASWPVKTDSDDETPAADSSIASTKTDEEHNVSEIAGRDEGVSVGKQDAEFRNNPEDGGECGDTAAESIGEVVAKVKPESIDGQAQWSEGKACSGTDDGQEEDTELSPNDPPKEQPLVGYWSWENTYRVHKMKMHLGKGSDLCLHVCLAVLTNQLRYERNAVAVTV